MSQRQTQNYGNENKPVTLKQLEEVLARSFTANNAILKNEIKKDMDKAFDDFAISVKSGFDAIDDRFEKIDERFERIDQRFERIEIKLEGMDSRIRGLDSRMDHFAESYIKKETVGV